MIYEKEIILTEDGSHSLALPQLNVTYHSVHGAIQESKHVFIEAGLKCFLNQSTPQPLTIFEMGLGTGLNAFLTAIEAEKHHRKIGYTAVELFPVSIGETRTLNYPQQLGHEELFKKIQECDWNEEILISEFFTLRKENTSLLSYTTAQQYNLIYYDAFAPNAQAELWTKEVFEKLFSMLVEKGILVTYCSKGDVRRAMIAAGFKIEKLKGAPGKREMSRAIKI